MNVILSNFNLILPNLKISPSFISVSSSFEIFFHILSQFSFLKNLFIFSLYNGFINSKLEFSLLNIISDIIFIFFPFKDILCCNSFIELINKISSSLFSFIVDIK